MQLLKSEVKHQVIPRASRHLTFSVFRKQDIVEKRKKKGDEDVEEMDLQWQIQATYLDTAVFTKPPQNILHCEVLLPAHHAC